MKKLESLKSSKFEGFEFNEIQNMNKIVGGIKTLPSRGGRDTYTNATNGSFIGGDGTAYDCVNN